MEPDYGEIDNPCHSGPRALDAIGISHFDLDTLGGVMRVLGEKPWSGRETLFWQIAAEVDTRGVHKLSEIKAEFAARNHFKDHGIMQDSADYLFEGEWDDAIESLNAFWAWSESNRLFPPKDGEVEDVTEFFRRACDALTGILSGDAESLLAAGKEWAESKAMLNQESLITVYGDWDSGTVALRRSKQFVNHLYELPGGGRETYKAVVGFNPERKAITVSLADPIEGLPMAQFVQALWPDCLAIDPESKKPLTDKVFPHPGDALLVFPDADIQFLAGGRDVIAGSPRGREMTMYEAYEAAEKLAAAL